MRDLIRAAIQYACEAVIYACSRVLEHLAAERPMLDDPLPDTMPGTIDDFSGYRFGLQLTADDYADLGQRLDRITEAERSAWRQS